MLYRIVPYITLLLCFSHLEATPYAITLLKGPSNQLIYFISEDHELNDPQAQDFVNRFLEIMRAREQSADPGYHVLVESTYFPKSEVPDTEFHEVRPDLLDQLMGHVFEFQKCTIENIEVRKISMVALALLWHGWPDDISTPFMPTEPYSRTDRAESCRSYLRKRYQCELERVTLCDVIAEFNRQIEAINVKKKAYKESEIKTVDDSLVVITKRIASLQEDFKKEGFSDKEALLPAIHNSCNTKDGYGEMRLKLRRSVSGPATFLFDLFLYMRILDLLKQSPHSPIVVIAGGAHVYNVMAPLATISSCTRIFEKGNPYPDRGLEKNHAPLKPEDLDILTRPLITIPEKYPILS